MQPGVLVAHAHGVNANLLFGWRRLHHRGLLDPSGTAAATLLPVKVTEPTITPTRRSVPPPKWTSRDAVKSAAASASAVEVLVGEKFRIRLEGSAQREVLERLLAVTGRLHGVLGTLASNLPSYDARVDSYRMDARACKADGVLAFSTHHYCIRSRLVGTPCEGRYGSGIFRALLSSSAVRDEPTPNWKAIRVRSILVLLLWRERCVCRFGRWIALAGDSRTAELPGVADGGSSAAASGHRIARLNLNWHRWRTRWRGAPERPALQGVVEIGTDVGRRCRGQRST